MNLKVACLRIAAVFGTLALPASLSACADSSSTSVVTVTSTISSAETTPWQPAESPSTTEAVIPEPSWSRGSDTGGLEAAPIPGASLEGNLAPDPQNDSQIYVIPGDWSFLETPGMIIPGALMTNVTRSGQCSQGWIAGRDQEVYMVTAGHCGEVGDRFSIRDAYGNEAVFGEVTWSAFEQVSGYDLGLIYIYPEAHHLIDPAIPLNDVVVQGTATPAELERQHPMVCRIGYRTEAYCGTYLNYTSEGLFDYRGFAKPGDSGGPVFVIDNQGNYWAAGVTSYITYTDGSRQSAMSIAEMMNYFGLTLYTYLS